ncbi:MAG: M28 family peptidase [Verrucomicrobia bacterium]|nr:M28 family peptidase [Verrucomicrobiota bacterium]
MFLPRLLPLPPPLLLPLSVSLSVVTASAADPVPKITAASLQARTAMLASDAFEGRAPASAGEEKTVAYLEREFRALGLKPGNPDGTYIQKVPMVGITSRTKSTFTAGDSEVSFTPITEYTASSRRLKPQIDVKDTDIVFVGYGIVAPEYGWDDYKGLDVRGKTVLMLVNDAPVVDPATGKLDPSFFKGNAMTYYGRWTYKYEIASAKGAAACLIIHETGPAGYPFAVLGGGWGTESFDLISPDKNEGRVAIEGWVTHTALERLLTAAGAPNYPALKAAAVKRDFKPIPLAAHASFSVTNTTREVASKNVIAKLDGADPLLRDDYIVYTAHWDHLGRNAKLTGDQIFNGAADNAIGTAVLLEIAQGFASLPAAARPQRSLLFLAVTAEEKGLLGARYYATHPLYPLKKTLANINIDGAQTKGVSRDIEVIGYGNSTLDDLAAAILQKTNRILVPDTEPQKGYFYRSDHFEFAKEGVPAFYTHSGKDIIGPTAGYGKKRSDDYTTEDYHKVSDEIKPWWDFEGTATDTRLFFELGREVANTSKWPEWKPGTEFKAKRDAMLQ